MSVQCKKPPFTNTMFIDRSKFQEQFKKGSLKERLFQNLTISFREDLLGICLCSHSQVAPIHQSHVHGWIKISITFLREVTQGTFL